MCEVLFSLDQSHIFFKTENNRKIELANHSYYNYIIHYLGDALYTSQNITWSLKHKTVFCVSISIAANISGTPMWQWMSILRRTTVTVLTRCNRKHVKSKSGVRLRRIWQYNMKCRVDSRVLTVRDFLITTISYYHWDRGLVGWFLLFTSY